SVVLQQSGLGRGAHWLLTGNSQAMKNRIVLLELMFAMFFTLTGANAQTAVAPRAEAVVPQQAPPAAVAPQAPSSTLDNYILSPNDIVLVKVFGDPDLDSQP